MEARAIERNPKKMAETSTAKLRSLPEAADRLGRGDDPARVVPNDEIDLSNSLAPFVLYFDEQNVLIS